MQSIAVLGLGQMGSTLARLFLAAGLRVHVWNRHPEKAEVLRSTGAIPATDAAQAVAEAMAVVMCVHDDAAAREILAAAGVMEALKGKLLVQLTTCSPQEARSMAAALRDIHAGYLGGAIQVAPEQMGKPDTTILLSGARTDHEAARGLLAVLGGNIVYLGDDPAAAATMDLATLSFVYGASMGFFQGAALAQAEGLDVARYGAIVETMAPSFGAFLRHEGQVIQREDFAVSQSPLSISVEATRRIETAMKRKGVHAALPTLIARLLSEAGEAGYGQQEFAAIVKLLQPKAAP